MRMLFRINIAIVQRWNLDSQARRFWPGAQAAVFAIFKPVAERE